MTVENPMAKEQLAINSVLKIVSNSIALLVT
jgi:hypothetical protein